MKKEEWLEYFQLINGYEPSEAEVAQALAAGDFQEEDLEEISEQAEFLVTDSLSPLGESAEEAKVKKFCIHCGNELTVDTRFCPKCGAVQDRTSAPANQTVINTAELQKTASGYWTWLKKALRYPVSTPTSEMANSYLWITFGLIVVFLAVGFASLLGSLAFFFIVLIFGAGVTLLLNWLYGALANGLMKTKFKFFDIFKMNMQASIYAVPVSALVFIFCILGKLSLNSAIGTTQSAFMGGYSNFAGVFSAFAGLGFLGLIIYALLFFAALVRGDLFIMAVYRETTAVEGSKIDNYPWFKLLYGIVIVVIVFILSLILGAMLVGIVSKIGY
ncbi:MAG: zinc ribbon domain-containing protein [Streptococcaceae bacterium]|jgi:hypothetical protein|nr:zinc ribbon domain-containing protein [Streptococcaceae bacterium]